MQFGLSILTVLQPHSEQKDFCGFALLASLSYLRKYDGGVSGFSRYPRSECVTRDIFALICGIFFWEIFKII